MLVAIMSLGSMAVQEIRWGKGGSQPADNYTFLYGNGNANLLLGTGFSVHQGTRSAVKKVKFISDRMSCIILRGHWCYIIVQNVHASIEVKSDVTNSSFHK
jgi:hypothetical protein